MFFIGVAVLTESLRLGVGSTRQPGIGYFPFLVGVALSVITLCPLLKNLLVAKRDKGREMEKFFGPFALNVGKIVAILFVYVIIFQWLGNILSNFLLFIILFKVGGFRKWAFILLYSFLITSLSYLLFSYCLGLRFPKGFLGF